jgi:hypothetical protein
MRSWGLLFIVGIAVTAGVMGVTTSTVVACVDGHSFIYDAHGMKDPFLPLVTAGGAIITYDTDFAVSEMVLEGVISDGGGRIAIINGNIIEQGKMIGLYTVQNIEQDRVILLKDGETSVLQLKKEE